MDGVQHEVSRCRVKQLDCLSFELSAINTVLSQIEVCHHALTAQAPPGVTRPREVDRKWVEEVRAQHNTLHSALHKLGKNVDAALLVENKDYLETSALPLAKDTDTDNTQTLTLETSTKHTDDTTTFTPPAHSGTRARTPHRRRGRRPRVTLKRRPGRGAGLRMKSPSTAAGAAWPGRS